MPLELDELLKIQVDIDKKDPILQKISKESMVRYLADKGFAGEETHSSGNYTYMQHPTLMDSDGEEEYQFGIAMPGDDHNPAAEIGDFFYNVQRFHELNGEEKPTQLQILNDLL